MENWSRQPIVILVAIFLIIYLTAASSNLFVATMNKIQGPQRETINVEASGKVDIVPNIAFVELSVENEDKSPEKVQTVNEQKTKKLVKALINLGIDKKDIKTEFYDLNPVKNKAGKTVSYKMRQTINVKIKDIEKAGSVLSAAPKYGATNVSSLNFGIEDPDKFKDKARKEAFDKAKTKAKELADLAGAKLGKILKFSERSSDNILEKGLRSYAAGVGMSDSIEPGTNEIRVTVNIKYQLL